MPPFAANEESIEAVVLLFIRALPRAAGNLLGMEQIGIILDLLVVVESDKNLISLLDSEAGPGQSLHFHNNGDKEVRDDSSHMCH